MSEHVREHVFDDDDDDLIFVNGVAFDPDLVDSAIDALARDEAAQADEAPARSRG